MTNPEVLHHFVIMILAVRGQGRISNSFVLKTSFFRADSLCEYERKLHFLCIVILSLSIGKYSARSTSFRKTFGIWISAGTPERKKRPRQQNNKNDNNASSTK